MLGETRLQTSFDIAVVAKAADGDSRNLGNRTQLHHQVNAASVRQSNIADEQIEFVADRSFHSRTDIVSRRDEVSATDEQFLQRSASVLMVINEQNLQTLLRSFTPCFWRDGRRFNRRERLHRQDERGSAIAPFAVHSECTAVRLRERFRNGQPETQAAKTTLE